MEKELDTSLRNSPGPAVPASGTSIGDIFICGTAKACTVKNCFKRNTHFHCSLCPDRRLVKEQNMVPHQIYHVNGRIEKRTTRDRHFTAYNGSCGRAACRFDMANKKHHHCNMCDWPCCGRKLQRCVAHIKSKHPEVYLETVKDTGGPMTTSNKQNTSSDLPVNMAVEGEKDSAVSTDIKKEQVKEGIGSHEDVLTKEFGSTRTEKEQNMIELKSMVWEPPISNAKKMPNGHPFESQHAKGSDHLDFQESKNIEENADLLKINNGNNVNGGNFETARFSDAENDSSQEGINALCKVAGCLETRNHFHCTLCDFSTNKKLLLERHKTIHSKGFHEKRKQRDKFFNEAICLCDFEGCRFIALKQRHFHCKLCGWACSSRKLQRCIKHIEDKHSSAVKSQSYSADANSPPPPLEDVGQERGPLLDFNEIPGEEELFFTSRADTSCEINKCFFQGLHYHCRKCPYVTRQKQSRARHRSIHLKGFPERRMMRDLHFLIYDGVCGRPCRFSIPKRKHFHCKYCDWACCARKLPRCLNHLKRKHSQVIEAEEETPMQTEVVKKRRIGNMEESHSGRAKCQSENNIDLEEQNRVIILDEASNGCGFVIKDVHSLRDGAAATDEDAATNASDANTELEVSSRSLCEPDDRMVDRTPDTRAYGKHAKHFNRPAHLNGPMFVNGHGYPMRHVERPIICRVCRAYASEHLPLRKMVVYSAGNRLELDLRLTSLLCTYFHVSIEDAFNSYICERDFEDWCSFHARKISVYPVIAVESGYDPLHNPRVVPMEEHFGGQY